MIAKKNGKGFTGKTKSVKEQFKAIEKIVTRIIEPERNGAESLEKTILKKVFY